MNIWSRIKYWFSGHGNNTLDIEDAMRGTDYDDFDPLDSVPDSDLGGECPCFNIHPERLDYSAQETPALYRKETK